MSSRLPRRAWIELGAVLLLMALTTAVFCLTDWDVQIALRFFDASHPEQPWPLKAVWLVKPIYDYAFAVIVFSAVVALLVFVAGFYSQRLKLWRRQALYVVLVIAIGPGLVVNLLFKDHWGRPRPVHVSELGGQYAYVPPAKISDSPDKSFVCGHCSVGYAAFAAYFLIQDAPLLYLLLAAGLGLVIGWTRMAVGGHFLSDVLWSGYSVFLVAYALHYGWYRRELGQGVETEQ